MSLATRSDRSVGWLASGLQVNAAPVISAGDFGGASPNFTDSVSDAESVAFSLGSLACNETVTWTIPSGNEAGKFAINASTSEITLAATLNWWNLNFLTGGSTYALTIRATDSGGLYDEVTLTVTVTSIYSDDRILEEFLNETSGTAMIDTSGVAGNGVYSGVALAQLNNPGGITAPLSDGINDFGDFYTAALNAALNVSKGTFSLWFKPFDSGFWASTTLRYVFAMWVTTNNFFGILKWSSANQLNFALRMGSVNKDIIISSLTDTGWMHLAMTFDKAAAAGSGEFMAYINGVQVGSTQNALGTWNGGALSATQCCLFANNTSGGSPSKAYVSYWRIFDEALPAAHIAKLAAEFDA